MNATNPELDKSMSRSKFELTEAAGAFTALQPLLGSVSSIESNANHVELHSDKARQLPLSRNILEGNASADSINIDKEISFDLSADGCSIYNLHGVSLSLTAFGNKKAVSVTGLDSINPDSQDKKVIAHVENPLPQSAIEILDMPGALPIALDVRNDKIQAPPSSAVFKQIAASAGQTLPGLIFSDAFNDIAEISLFAEKNPKWIHDVIKPMFEEVKKQAENSPLEQTQQKQVNKNGNSLGGSNSNDSGNDGSADSPKDTQRNDSRSEKTADSSLEKATEKEVKTGNTDGGNRNAKSGDFDKIIVIDGQQRHYSLHVPAHWDPAKPMPLLLMLHGRGSDGKDFAKSTNMNEKADQEGFAVAYPDATKWFGRKDLSAWDAANGLIPPGAKSNDLQFLRSVIEKSQRELNIDPNRIYMIGHSSGGMMTYLAASELSDKLAAVGTVSSAMSGKEPKPKYPVSVISTHGTNDEVIPITGLKDVPPILSELGIPTFKTPGFATDFWKRQDGITKKGNETTDGDIYARNFANPSNGAAVTELTLKNGSHTPEEKFHTYDLVLKFLMEHPKSKGSVPPSSDPDRLIDRRPNPINELVKDVKKRGADGIADDVGKIYDQASLLPNGSIHPARMLEGVEAKIGCRFDTPITKLIESTTDLSKKDKHISLNTDKPNEFKIGVRAGSAEIQSVSLNNIAFDLDSFEAHPKLNNIQGVSFNLQAFGLHSQSALHTITDMVNDKGKHTYSLNMQNPLPPALRKVMLASDTVDINADVDTEGNFKISNEHEIKDQTFGKNPLTRGYIDEATDVARLWQDPDNAWRPLRRDIGITTTCMTIGAMIPKVRLVSSIIGATVAAPAVSHFVHEAF